MASRRLIDRLRRRGGAGRAGRTALEVGPDLDDRDETRVRELITDALRRHATMTANFTYEPDRIADRAEAYGAHGEVRQSAAVRELVAE